MLQRSKDDQNIQAQKLYNLTDLSDFLTYKLTDLRCIIDSLSEIFALRENRYEQAGQ